MHNTPRYRRIEAIAQAHVDAGSFSGVEWQVMRGSDVWAKGRVGLADAPNKVAMASSPVYRIYSMTKPLVSAVALMLVEEGKMRLYDPIAAYLPEFAEMSILDESGNTRPAQGPIIVEHLMTHRAGLSYGFLPNCPVGRIYREEKINNSALPLEDVVKKIATLPLAFEPGSQWRYSVATDVLGRLVEVVSGKKLSDILDEYITGPLAMKDTGFMVPKKERSRIMAMFGRDDLDYLMDFDDQPQKLVPADLSQQYPADDPHFRRGGYGLFSTLDDYVRFARFLATGLGPKGERMISRKMMELMWTNRIPESQQPLHIGPINLAGYGFGLAGRVLIKPGEALGLTSLGECGWAGAASTYFWIDPAEDMIGVVMAQYLGSKLPIGDDIRNAVYQALDG